MALTYQNVIDRARNTLNDPDKVAFADSELLTYLEQAVALLRLKRPDIFTDKLSVDEEESYPLDIANNIPFPDKYFPALVHFVVGMANLKDDQHTLNQRSQLSFNMFTIITGIAVLPPAGAQ